MRSFVLFAVLLMGAAFPAAAQEADQVPASGKELYEAWCSRCHGLDGRGPAEDLQLDTPVPDLADCSFNSREPRRDWKAVILYGGSARGLSMTMPAWSEALTKKQADSIIDHIKTFCTEQSWPAGELNFRRAHGTTKAFPENEALLIPTFTMKELTSTTKLVYEERIGPVGQWEISVPFESHTLSETRIGDVELAGKITLFHNANQLSIISAGIETTLPTGTFGAWKISPFVAAAKGYGKFVIQASVKVEKPLETGFEDEVLYNVALTIPLTSEKQGLYPMLELNGIKALGHSEHTILLTPQVYFAPGKRGHIALSAGTQIPGGGTKPFDYRIVLFLLWEYADGGLWW